MENKKQQNSLIVSIIILIIVGLGIFYFVRQGGNSNMQPSAQNQSGLQVTTLSPGSGAAAKAGDTVSVNYTGTLADGTVFDSNVDPKFNHVAPFSFTLGAGMVIKGWDEGVVGMQVGEKRELVISPELGYGASVVGPIPANSTLTFEVELLKIGQ